jgi:hypothetical protein
MKIGDPGNSRFWDLRLVMASRVGTPFYIAPKMRENAEYRAAADVHLFSLIARDVFVREPSCPATLSPAALMKKVVKRPGHRCPSR